MKGEKGAFVMMPDGDVMNVGHELEMKERCKQQGHNHTSSFFSAFPYIIQIWKSDLGILKSCLFFITYIFVPGLNLALSRSAFMIKSIPASVLIQTCPCSNETKTMSAQDMK